jgi:hypothetical protein
MIIYIIDYTVYKGIIPLYTSIVIIYPVYTQVSLYGPADLVPAQGLAFAAYQIPAGLSLYSTQSLRLLLMYLVPTPIW